jgi:PTS system nitrogen regulatory IIA component
MDSDTIGANEEIMTIEELAQYLKVPQETITRMVQRGEIPFVKIESQLRFMKALIDDWLLARMKERPKPAVVRVLEQGEVVLPLSRIVRPEYILLRMEPGTVESALEQLVGPLVRTGVIPDGEDYIRLLKEREDMASTALSNGVALPHARYPSLCDATEQAVVTGICREGMFFNALDRKKTRLFFLVCTDSDIVHLKIMSKLAYLIKDRETIERLIDSKNEHEILSILSEADEEIDRNG